MDNEFDKMREAVSQARVQIAAVDNVVGAMAELMIGRLRTGNVSQRALTQLKKELAGFNMHTGKWSKK